MDIFRQFFRPDQSGKSDQTRSTAPASHLPDEPFESVEEARTALLRADAKNALDKSKAFLLEQTLHGTVNGREEMWWIFDEQGLEVIKVRKQKDTSLPSIEVEVTFEQRGMGRENLVFSCGGCESAVATLAAKQFVKLINKQPVTDRRV